MNIAFPFIEVQSKRDTWAQQRLIAEMYVKSVRRHMPDARLFQMADLETPALPVDEVVRVKPTAEFVPWLMECKTKVPHPVIFTDTDMIVQRDLAPMLNVPCDVLLTTRGPKVFAGRQMPFLLGVAVSHTPALWQEVLERVKAMPDEEDRGWWGGQVALFQMWMEEKEGRGKWKIEAVNCNPHNYAPTSEDDQPADKWVLHYKGPKRKPWMLKRWESEYGEG